MKKVLTLLLLALGSALGASRLKDLVSLEGARDNQLIGYGLVVGLNGTGDKRQTVFSAQSLTNMLERMGVTVPATAILVRNTAAVMVTADLPAYAQPGAKIDVTAAAIGDAANLQGGMLLMTPLRAANGQVYVVAQGSVITGGFAAGRGGNTQTLNHPTVGRIPDGGIIEQSPPSVPPGNRLKLQLHQPDFTTAARIAAALNQRFAPNGPPLAHAENSALVVVEAPPQFLNKDVDFMAAVDAVQVEVDRPARIVINERTGTIVMGKDVAIAPISILQGGLTVEIRTKRSVSQPLPQSKGVTTPVSQTSVSVRQDKAKNVVLQEGATVEDLVRALTAIGSTSRDIIAILQNLKAEGALDAELDVI
jgi:flagellar P-ring protein FlgI